MKLFNIDVKELNDYWDKIASSILNVGIYVFMMIIYFKIKTDYYLVANSEILQELLQIICIISVRLIYIFFNKFLQFSNSLFSILFFHELQKNTKGLLSIDQVSYVRIAFISYIVSFILFHDSYFSLSIVFLLILDLVDGLNPVQSIKDFFSYESEKNKVSKILCVMRDIALIIALILIAWYFPKGFGLVCSVLVTICALFALKEAIKIKIKNISIE
ncbi:hypothetical protein [uncultured Faecalicoccus sp.]|uniref:hypothetical protein n=1 Tax=uncultured Faecalicoccus sp. TaxID=1971760 RepID=UPI002586B82D|nr:hypothetical protein [uncultured Faecalicoccus sp.]